MSKQLTSTAAEREPMGEIEWCRRVAAALSKAIEGALWERIEMESATRYWFVREDGVRYELTPGVMGNVLCACPAGGYEIPCKHQMALRAHLRRL